MKKSIIAWSVFLMMGCNSEPNLTSVDSVGPLSVEQWKVLPTVEKYSPENLERLRSHDPSLSRESNWDDFMRVVVVQERRRDIPSQY